MNRKLAVLLAVTIGVLTFASPALASSPHPILTISVSPTRVELSVRPGKTVTQKYVIRAGAVPVRISAEAIAFTMTTNGKVTIANVPRAVSGVTWLRVPRPFTLRAGQSRTATVTITEPKGAEPGQRYLAVAWSATAATAKTTGTHVTLSGSVAAELIVDLPGVAIRKNTFGLSAPSFTWGSTVPATISDRNTGNVYNLLNAQKVAVNGTPSMIGGLFVLGGASRDLAAPVHLHWGWNHLSYRGISKTVLYIPGVPLLIGLLVLAAALVVFFAGRIGRKKRGPGMRRADPLTTRKSRRPVTASGPDTNIGHPFSHGRSGPGAHRGGRAR